MIQKLLNVVARFFSGGLLLAFVLLVSHPAFAQLPFGSSSLVDPAKKNSKRLEKQIEQPSQPPSLTIPAEPLGFSAPGPIYLGQRTSMASLDFLDEDHLLFTFRVPGLLHRDPSFDNGLDSNEHHIRAVVLELPSGAVKSEALWTLHDRSRYLWMLKDGGFLLRDGSDLKQGDATLALKPLLHFPGPLSSVQMDPLGKFLVTNSREPVAAIADAADKKQDSATTPTEDAQPQLRLQIGPRLDAQPESEIKTNLGLNAAANADAGDIPVTASTGSGTTTDSAPATKTSPAIVVRILDRSSGQVLLVTRVHSAVHLPINSDGYLEALHERDTDWTLNHYAFDGVVVPLGSLVSNCMPAYEFANDREVLITTCSSDGGSQLIARTMDGRQLWQASLPNIPVWPRTERAANGLRFAYETLAVDRSVSATAPLELDDLKAQRVNIYDAANGKVVLTATASPVLDAGGNVALSPSGRRVAVLHAGMIELWNLDTPPPLPVAAPASHP